MCDPMVGAIIGVVGSMASAAYSYSQQSSLMAKQEQANAQWVAYQRKERNEAWQRDQEARQKAEAARQGALDQLKPEEQKAAQTTEQQRVQQDITPKDMADVETQLIGDKLLSGQAGADPAIKQDIAGQITQASRDARARIAALSTIESYGGSQFGLQNRAQNVLNQSGQDIRLQGDIRQGNNAALGVATNVEPLRYQATPSMAGGIASSLAGIAGKSFGGSF